MHAKNNLNIGNVSKKTTFTNDIHMAQMCDFAVGVEEKQGIYNDIYNNPNSVDAARNHTEKDITLWIDAIISSPELLKRFLGEDVYEVVKDSIHTDKRFYSTYTPEEIRLSNDFLSYKDRIIKERMEKIQQEASVEIEKTIKASVQIPQDLEDAKEGLKNFKKTIAFLLNEKDIDVYAKAIKDAKKIDISLYDIYNKIDKNDVEKYTAIDDLLCYYIPHKNKKYLIHKADVHKKMKDFGDKVKISHILEVINKDIQNINNKIQKSQKTMEQAVMKTISKKSHGTRILSIDESELIESYMQEVLQKGTDQVYGIEDLQSMKNIREWFAMCMDETFRSFSPEEVDITIDGKDMLEMQRRQQKTLMYFKDEFDLRSTILGRIIEYCIVEYMKYIASLSLKTTKQSSYVKVQKTSLQDDIYAGVDFAVTYKQNGKDVVDFWDLIISNDPDSISQKQAGNKNPKKPYDFFIQTAIQHEKDHVDIPPVQRRIFAIEPLFAYAIIWEYLQNVKKTGNIYTPNDINALTNFFNTQCNIGGDIYKRYLYLAKNPLYNKRHNDKDIGVIPQYVGEHVATIFRSNMNVVI